MSLVSENIAPSTKGQKFGTNAKTKKEVETLVDAISKIEGVKKVIANQDEFPVEVTIITSEWVAITTIQQAAINEGFHLIRESLFFD
jgi:hypothetical protein